MHYWMTQRRWGVAAFAVVVAMLLGAAVGAFGAVFGRRTAKAKPLASAGVGLLAFFLIPIIAIAAFFTVVGIPLGLVLLLLVLPLYAISYVTAAFALGRRIIKGSRILAFLVGLVILGLLTLIPIAGGLIGFLAVVFGLGLLLVTLFRARS